MSFCSAVAHTGTKSAEHLEYSVFHHALICHTALNTFRNQLLRVRLEVTILTSVLHCRDGTHTTVNLVLSALIQLEGSRALVTSGKHASHHADITARSNGLGDISGVLDTAICDDRDTELLRLRSSP